jgi:hypothetical protein
MKRIANEYGLGRAEDLLASSVTEKLYPVMFWVNF